MVTGDINVVEVGGKIDDEALINKVAKGDIEYKFILASYNCGAGHVEDAQRLAEKYGSNPECWDDVAYWLLQESKIQYSTDPVVKYGFCRGIEPVTYVK